MMAKKEFGSPATIYNRLTAMREKGWVMLAETEDARRKQIALTHAALQHFDKLSECVLDAAKKA
jgi:hypothetical protein